MRCKQTSTNLQIAEEDEQDTLVTGESRQVDSTKLERVNAPLGFMYDKWVVRIPNCPSVERCAKGNPTPNSHTMLGGST